MTLAEYQPHSYTFIHSDFCSFVVVVNQRNVVFLSQAEEKQRQELGFQSADYSLALSEAFAFPQLLHTYCS